MSRPVLGPAAKAAVLALLATAGSCMPEDPYSRVAAACMTQDPEMGKVLDPEVVEPTYLSQECKQALESVIPYDETSFRKAPPWVKDRVNEAFQALIAYPIKIPEQNSLLGTTPKQAGAIPAAFFEILGDWENPNQSLFNYVLNQTDVIEYEPELDGLTDARYIARRIILYPVFGHRHMPWELIRNPFYRAATLLHEARHGDGNWHSLCDEAVTGNTGHSCDNELLGGYGIEIAYLKYLLHGSATCEESGCSPPLKSLSVRVNGWALCQFIQRRINHRYDELDQLILGVDCDKITYKWVMEREGIPLPPSTVYPASDKPVDTIIGSGHPPSTCGGLERDT